MSVDCEIAKKDAAAETDRLKNRLEELQEQLKKFKSSKQNDATILKVRLNFTVSFSEKVFPQN